MQVLPSKTGVLINIVANINDCVRAGLDIKNDKTHLRAELNRHGFNRHLRVI